jgi:hypothetical protein
VGIVLWFWYLYDVYQHRIKKAIDFSMRHTFVSLVSLLISIALLPLIYFSPEYKWAILYGVFLFLGWISAIILGMTFKTLPFIVWNGHYKKLNGKVKIPLPKQLYNEKLLQYQFWVFLAALYILALSILFQQPVALRVSLFLWMALAGMYCFNVFKVLLHKTKILDGNSN